MLVILKYKPPPIALKSFLEGCGQLNYSMENAGFPPPPQNLLC